MLSLGTPPNRIRYTKKLITLRNDIKHIILNSGVFQFSYFILLTFNKAAIAIKDTDPQTDEERNINNATNIYLSTLNQSYLRLIKPQKCLTFVFTSVLR